jgi:hypothetical protein
MDLAVAGGVGRRLAAVARIGGNCGRRDRALPIL